MTIQARLSSPASRDATILLPDGRRLGFAEYGDASGVPVLFFHGIGASRVTRHPDDRVTARLGIRLIGVDRPGIGLSDPHPGRTLLGWADDVRALADALGIDRFAILGWSGGGPHALACAYRMPERLTAVGLGSTAGPLHRSEPGAYRSVYWRTIARLGQIGWLVRLAMWEQRCEARLGPEGFLDRYIRTLPPVDRQILADPAMRRMMLDATAEVYRERSCGIADDARVLTGPWGFSLERIKAPIYLWHGEADTTVPTAHAYHVARALPRCHARFYPGEGHFLIFPRWAEVLTALAAASRV